MISKPYRAGSRGFCAGVHTCGSGLRGFRIGLRGFYTDPRGFRAGLRGFHAGLRGFCAGLHTYRAGLRDFHAGLRGFCARVVCRCGFLVVPQKLNSEGRQKLSTKHEQTKMKFELSGAWVAQGLFWSFWWAGLRGFWLGSTRLQCFAAFSSRGGHETAKPNRNQVG